ncbi:MAG: NADH-quinone oxidoreductase subunit C [Gammaproteobacteria bacterium]|nr:NADH-quinone oxidoreductase subunit C [Gammaproteobacteria bacterium]NNM13853.1 NADH-quinone oxidoreductase subunit C [Gammaproteobacteria bacterium]
MNRATRLQQLRTNLQAGLGAKLEFVNSVADELTIEVSLPNLISVLTELRDNPAFAFDTLIDLCGVDYLSYGESEWKTESATSSGFTRGAVRNNIEAENNDLRFAVVYHLLSVEKNHRLRVRVRIADGDPPIVPSCLEVWASANWYEREAFDLYGILFEGHPDLRRILTDYGFMGHPFRKDFPLTGHVEVRYDPEKGRVAYEPVSIEPRVLVPKVIRHDNRYTVDSTEEQPSVQDGAEQ